MATNIEWGGARAGEESGVGSREQAGSKERFVSGNFAGTAGTLWFVQTFTISSWFNVTAFRS